MNFKTTGLLVGLLVIVVVVWLLLPKGAGPEAESVTPPPKTEEQKPVFDPQPKDDQLVRVEVERPGKPRMVFERVESKGETPRGVENWRIVEPLTAPADGYKVIGLARTLTGLQSRSQFEAGAKGQLTAAEAGLDPPTATITLVDKEGKRYTLETGKKAILSNDTYVRVAGQKTVQVATRDLQPQVAKDLKDYRAQRLLPFSLDDAVEIRITHEAREYDFSRSPGGEWVINQPLRANADRAKIREKLLTPLNTLQAAEFVDDASEPLARYGLDEPFLTLVITTETQPKPPADANQTSESQPESAPIVETHRLVVGGFADLKAERRYVRVDDGPGIVIVKQSDVAALTPQLSELRDPRVTRVKAADVTELQLTAGDSTALLKKVNGVWQGTGDLAQLETDAVQDLLDALAGLTAVNYIDEPEAPGTYGLDHPRAVITATATGLVTPITLRIGNETASGKNAYVQRDGEPGVIVVAEAQAARLALSTLALRAREVFTFPPEQLHNLTVRRGNVSYELVRAGEAWKFTVPSEVPIDEGNVRVLTLDLSHLRAKRVVARDDEARFGLDQPALTIRFELEQSPQTQAASQPAEPLGTSQHTLRIALKDNVSYAQKDDDPFVFELDETVYRVLTAELIDPRLFTFKPEEVVRVKIVATGGTLELAKEGTRWEYVPDRFAELSQKKVQDFIRDITQMRAETYLEYRAADLGAAGLLNAPASLTIQLADGREFVMNMTQELPGQLPRVAGLVAERRTFLLRQADAEKLLRGLDYYLKPAGPEGEREGAADEAGAGVPRPTPP